MIKKENSNIHKYDKINSNKDYSKEENYENPKETSNIYGLENVYRKKELNRNNYKFIKKKEFFDIKINPLIEKSYKFNFIQSKPHLQSIISKRYAIDSDRGKKSQSKINKHKNLNS